MADKTHIEWTDATWNPVTGCSKVSAGCKHCYAERDWARLSANPATRYYGRAFTDVQYHCELLDLPLRWKRPRRIFVNSMSDLFHPDVPDQFIADVFAYMAFARHHVFQVLTKRPERMRELLTNREWIDETYSASIAIAHDDACEILGRRGKFDANCRIPFDIRAFDPALPLANVWLGVSVEDQAAADERIPLLLQTPAAVRWVSAEPLLGAVDLRHLNKDMETNEVDALQPWTWEQELELWRGSSETWEEDFEDWFGGMEVAQAMGPCHNKIDWVVAGGESGPHARPMHLDWARSLRDQCAVAGIPFLFKQWGEFWPGILDRKPYEMEPWRITPNGVRAWGLLESMQPVDTWPTVIMMRAGKKVAGRLLDGIEHNGYPS